MKTTLIYLATLLVLAASNATAQIYESRDAQGNPVFTDHPAAGAEEVELQEGNIADAVEPRPHPEPESEPEPAHEPAQYRDRETVVEEDDPDYVVVDDERAERLRREAAERRHDGPVHAQPLPAHHPRPHVGGRR